MVNVRYKTLEVKGNHKSLFLKESDKLGRLVLGCIQNLEENPNDNGRIEELVNAVDDIRKAKFIQGREFETDDKKIVESFKGISQTFKKDKRIYSGKKYLKKFNKIS